MQFRFANFRLAAALEAPSKRSWWFCLPSFSNHWLWEYRRIAKKSNYKSFDHFCLNPQAKPPTRTHQWIQESKRIEVTGAWSLAVGFPHDLPWGVQSVPQEVLVFALGKLCLLYSLLDIGHPKHIGQLGFQLFLAGECAARGPCRKSFAGNDKAQADCHHRQLLVGPQLWEASNLYFRSRLGIGELRLVLLMPERPKLS